MYDDLEEQEAYKQAASITPSEYQAFLDQVEMVPSHRAFITGKTTRLAFEFMEDTGLRVNEMLHVRKQDVDFTTRVITVIMPKSEKHCKCSRWKNKDEYSRIQVLEYSDPLCENCHGKGKWKKPQKATFTPRIRQALLDHCNNLKTDDELLFQVTRQSLWKWGKKAGYAAGLKISQETEDKTIKGIFLHLFRALCSLRTTRDSKDDLLQDQLVSRKLRHSYQNVTDRYNKVDISYLLAWEERTYSLV